MDEHKSHEELFKEVAEAKKKLIIGKTYEHYKDSKKLYKVVYFATLESTDELVVVYHAQYGPGMYFVRPLTEWLETVEWQGKMVPRFRLVD
jgi:hypothetical protein